MNLEARYYMAYIENHEGRRYNIYRDSRGNWTIGVGHLCGEEDTFNELTMLNDKQIDTLFCFDIGEKTDLAIHLIPKFRSYPIYVKAAILDGFFRGDLSGSPKTIKLINEGKWLEASIEYLNNKEYGIAKRNKSGVWKRMLENSHHFLNYSEERNKQ